MSMSLGTLMSEVRRLDALDSCTNKCQLYFLRNCTIEMIEPYLKYSLYQENIRALLDFGDYDNIHQEILAQDSKLHATNPDVIVIVLMLENMLDLASLNGKVDEIKEQLNQIYSLVKDHTQALIAVNTFIPPFYSEWGIANSPSIHRLDYLVTDINQYIRDYAISNNDRFFLMDWDRLVRILGEEQSFDYRYWYSSKAPFKSAFLELYAREIAKIVRALKGKAKKCVVLDCDNTLWGGIIGEDGIDGIKLDKDSYPGKAFYDFQKNLIYLYERGVIICLCSKNNEDDVWEVLDGHPSCLLKRKHLSAWRINWEDKVTNIQGLVDELNIGMDSIVFVDDNPVECEYVRGSLPQVTVLEVPQKLYNYPLLLIKDGLFDILRISEEDKGRTAMYQAETLRNVEKTKFANLEEYLGSLGLKAFIHPVSKEEIPRTAQLTQKTNQFNLTTRRYSEAEIMAMAEDPFKHVFTLSVQDRYGEYGLTGVLIAVIDDKKCYIDSLLLSCRILGRRLEYAFLYHCCLELQRKYGIEIWEAEYITTVKNQQVSDFWDKAGFSVLKKMDGNKFYISSELSGKTMNIDFIKILEG